GGASLITEKAYLMGKFARVALGTRHIDYNGRLCMVSAGTAYKLAFDVDRSPIPWSDHAAKLIVADPRMTPISRNADLYLPLRPGTDLVLLMSMLHVILREGLEDKEFIEQ